MGLGLELGATIPQKLQALSYSLMTIERLRKYTEEWIQGNKQTLHEEHKSSLRLDMWERGREAFMQETFVKPILFPETRSLSASNSRSAKYLAWS